ncbi:MAG TPA: hypothetical protein VLY03_04760 [Bacteroidota bacterium]|nr:hypothetical protein [Bacteroidota bacterium]
MILESFIESERRLSVSIPLLTAVAIILVDVATPAPVMMSIFFVIPVFLAAWFNGFAWAIVISIFLPGARFLIATFLEHVWGTSYNLLNMADRMVVLVLISWIASRLSYAIRLLRIEVKTLTGLLPVCSNCKKIRDEKNVWHPIELYIAEHSEAQFSHGICPDCKELLYGKHLSKK